MADLSAQAGPGKKRASIVNILGLLLIIDSTLSLIRSAPRLAATNVFFGANANPKFAYDTIATILLFLSAFGLFMRKQWARVLVLCLMILSLCEGIFQFVLTNIILTDIVGRNDGPLLASRSYQYLTGFLIYTFFVAALFTGKVRAEFDAVEDRKQKAPQGEDFMKTAQRIIGPVVSPKVLAGAGAVLVVGLAAFFFLFREGVPQRRQPLLWSGRTAWISKGNLGRTNALTGRGAHRPDALLWKKRFARQASGLLAAGNRLFITTGDRLLVLHAETGTEQWVFTANPVSSTPLLVDDTVFVGTEIGALYALDAATGQEQWRYQTGHSAFSLNMTPIATAPCTDGEAVYFGNALGYLYAVDLVSRQELWKFKTRGPVQSSPAFDLDTVYFGSGDGNVYALSLLDGKTKWVHSAKGPVYATPVVSGDLVLYRNEDGMLIALDAGSGERQWTFPAPTLPNVRSSPAVVNDTVFVGDREGRFSALDLNSGAVKWQWFATKATTGTPAVADGIVYFSSGDGTVYALDADRGVERWRYKAEAPVESSFVVIDYVVFFSDTQGTVYALSENPELAAR